MFAAPVARRTLPVARTALQRRAYHPVNQVGTNFPFNYHGPSSRAFTYAYWGILGVAPWAITGLAYWLQMARRLFFRSPSPSVNADPRSSLHVQRKWNGEM
ncbi:hypothetical protein JCM10207_001907 [Rhodosporidiobolus poonsookiae]